MSTVECFPITTAPGVSRLFVDFCTGSARVQDFYGGQPGPGSVAWHPRPALPDHWNQIVREIESQNPGAGEISLLKDGAGVVVTGQQVGLFGGPLFTPLKAATALARARQASAGGNPHVAIFWLASEDHDFAEIDHVSIPARRQMRKLVYESTPDSPRPVGGLLIDDSISALLDQAWELLGTSDAMDALVEAYRPGRTFAQAFADFYRKAFSDQGLLVFDAAGREVHRIGAPVLRSAIERADELHSALLSRKGALVTAGYHAQVAVAGQSSLIFLIDAATGARVALKRAPASIEEPKGIWQAGRDRYTTEDLLGILESEPERISPSALLRPVFQDFLLSTSLTIGGPAEIAYFAQSEVIFQKIAGRMTPVQPRFSATLIEPAIAELLRTHELSLERIFEQDVESIAQILAARAVPIEGKRKLSAAGNALDSELDSLLTWMHALDAGLGRSGDTAASKMRYQMNRLRRLTANFQMQCETSLHRHAETIVQSLFPHGGLQERLHAAAYYFARYGFELSQQMVDKAADACPGHTAIWL